MILSMLQVRLSLETFIQSFSNSAPLGSRMLLSSICPGCLWRGQGRGEGLSTLPVSLWPLEFTNPHSTCTNIWTPWSKHQVTCSALAIAGSQRCPHSRVCYPDQARTRCIAVGHTRTSTWAHLGNVHVCSNLPAVYSWPPWPTLCFPHWSLSSRPSKDVLATQQGPAEPVCLPRVLLKEVPASWNNP